MDYLDVYKKFIAEKAEEILSGDDEYVRNIGLQKKFALLKNLKDIAYVSHVQYDEAGRAYKFFSMPSEFDEMRERLVAISQTVQVLSSLTEKRSLRKSDAKVEIENLHREETGIKRRLSAKDRCDALEKELDGIDEIEVEKKLYLQRKKAVKKAILNNTDKPVIRRGIVEMFIRGYDFSVNTTFNAKLEDIAVSIIQDESINLLANQRVGSAENVDKVVTHLASSDSEDEGELE